MARSVLTNRRPLLAVDAPILLHRAHHRGRNAIQGSVLELASIIAIHKPRAVAICMGLGAAVYRVSQHPDYHAKRPPKPRSLERSFEGAPDVYQRLGWSIYTSTTLEADDLVFSLAKAEAAAGGRTLIVTGDKDLYGAVSSKTRLIFLGPTRIPNLIGPHEVMTRYGIAPYQVPDYIALAGDRSDGIPGAHRVGAKGASSLLRAHGTLERVIQRTPKLQTQAPQLHLYKQIATLQTVSLSLPPSRQTDWKQGNAFLGLGS